MIKLKYFTSRRLNFTYCFGLFVGYITHGKWWYALVIFGALELIDYLVGLEL